MTKEEILERLERAQAELPKAIRLDEGYMGNNPGKQQRLSDRVEWLQNEIRALRAALDS